MGKAFSSLGLDDTEEEAEVGLILHSRPNSYFNSCETTKQGCGRFVNLDSLYANSFRIVRNLHYSYEFAVPPPPGAGGPLATADKEQSNITRPTVLFVHGRVVPSSSSSSSTFSHLLSQNSTNGSTCSRSAPPIDLLVHTGGFGRTAYDLLQFDEWLQEVGKLAKSKLLILNPEVDVAAIQLLKRKQLLLHCSSAIGTTKIVTAAVLSNVKMSGSGRMRDLSCSFSMTHEVWNAGPSMTDSARPLSCLSCMRNSLPTWSKLDDFW